jgi:hypothetical protein
MSQQFSTTIAVIGIDIGKNSCHVVGLNDRGAIALRQRWSRGQVETRPANIPPCLIGMEACVGAHHLSRRLTMLGHNARLMPARYVRPYSKGQKNDLRDAEAIAEAVQRPTMKFVATKTPEQLDLQALHRVRERLVSHRTGVINQIRAFLLERGIAVGQGLCFLRAELPQILATRPVRGLSGNEIARALISMMARSQMRSNQRPDTLMQDRIRQIDENLLRRTAGPYIGSNPVLGAPSRHVRLAAVSSLDLGTKTGRRCANRRHWRSSCCRKW